MTHEETKGAFLTFQKDADQTHFGSPDCLLKCIFSRREALEQMKYFWNLPPACCPS